MPGKRNVSCATLMMFFLSAFESMALTSVSSIRIWPPVGA